MSDFYEAVLVLGAFCIVFGMIGNLMGELIIYALTRFGWIKPRVVTVRHIIEREAGE